MRFFAIFMNFHATTCAQHAATCAPRSRQGRAIGHHMAPRPRQGRALTPPWSRQGHALTPMVAPRSRHDPPWSPHGSPRPLPWPLMSGKVGSWSQTLGQQNDPKIYLGKSDLLKTPKSAIWTPCNGGPDLLRVVTFLKLLGGTLLSVGKATPPER